MDDVKASGSGSGINIGRKNMRIRLALRFGSDRAEDGEDVTREDQVRAAFNSPFWPFVVATTSIGQEGLDFHQYCHAVVHWNLPCENGAHIERHILNLPMSREVQRLHDLRRSLVAYRVVFGQPRQEDMLAYLLEHVPEADQKRMADELRINLEPEGCKPQSGR